MRRFVTFALAWLAAAALAVGVAWQGVGIVTRQVTDDRPAALGDAEVRQLAGTATSAAPSIPTTAPGVSTTTTPPATAPAATAVSPPPPPAGAETRTYNVVGGSAALRFAPEGVTVLWATPSAGFEVDVEAEHVNGVRVEFESDAHRSRVDGWWANGPQDRVREEPR